MVKAGYDFKATKFTLKEYFDEKSQNNRPFYVYVQKGAQEKKREKSIFTFWSLPQDPGEYRRDQKGTWR